MGNFKENIYQLFIGLYRVLPYKKAFCLALKRLNVPRSKFYTDLRFNGEFKVKLSSDVSFRLINYGASIENEIFWNGPFVTWENDTGWIWKQLCLSSKVVFDVGANTGLYSLITKSLNPQAKVYAFEPSQNTYHKLSKNDQLNSFGIHCEQIALSNMDGKQVFYDVEDSNQTSASLSPDKLKNWEGHTGETVEYDVRTMKLSSYIQENDITSIDLIKIDVEMHEPSVIEGFGELLLKFKPAVVIEVLSQKVADNLNALIDPKEHLIFHLKGHEEAVAIDRFQLKPEEWNFIFFHRDREQDIRAKTNFFDKVIG